MTDKAGKPTDITTVTGRENLKKLPVRKAPYWRKLERGQRVGFYWSGKGAGSWHAEYFDRNAQKQVRKAIELPAGTKPADAYAVAKNKATEWFKHLGLGGAIVDSTVSEVCADYVADLAEKGRLKASLDAQARFRRWVDDDKIGRLPVSKLMEANVRDWVSRLRAAPVGKAQGGKVRADSSLNRDMNTLRAALNMALVKRYATSDLAWSQALLPIKNATRRRDLYLSKEARRKLIAHAPADLAAFISGLSLLPLRPGALAGLTVDCLNLSLGQLKIGMDKAGQDRKILLPAQTLAFFKAQAKDKLPKAPLLARADGSAWNKDAWKGPIKESVEAAGLERGVTAYTLRHSVITDLVKGGLDLMTVAQISGTSVAMIEAHYAQLQQEHAARALESLSL